MKDLLKHFKPEDFADGGLVDFVLGAEPHTGAFVMAYNDHPMKKQYMSYFKFGDGPLYMFYTPYHLPHMQLPHTVARAVLFKDADTGAAAARRSATRWPSPSATSRPARASTAWAASPATAWWTATTQLPPQRLSADGAVRRLPAQARRRKGPADQLRDVELPVGRMCDKLRAEQTAFFSGSLRKAA